MEELVQDGLAELFVHGAGQQTEGTFQCTYNRVSWTNSFQSDASRTGSPNRSPRSRSNIWLPLHHSARSRCSMPSAGAFKKSSRSVHLSKEAGTGELQVWWSDLVPVRRWCGRSPRHTRPSNLQMMNLIARDVPAWSENTSFDICALKLDGRPVFASRPCSGW